MPQGRSAQSQMPSLLTAPTPHHHSFHNDICLLGKQCCTRVTPTADGYLKSQAAPSSPHHLQQLLLGKDLKLLSQPRGVVDGCAMQDHAEGIHL